MGSKNAGFLVRFIAFWLDALILLLPHAIAWSYLAGSSNLASFGQGIIFYITLLALPMMFFSSLFYYAWMTNHLGGTPGKLLTGLEIKNEDGNRLSYKRSFFRHTTGYAFSGVFFWLGFFSIIKDSEKLSWHDKAVGSKVVVNKSLWPVGLIFLFILLVVNWSLIVNSVNKFLAGPLKQEFANITVPLLIPKTPKLSTDTTQPQSSLNFQEDYQEISNLMNQANYGTAEDKANTLLISAQSDYEKALSYEIKGEIFYQLKKDNAAKTQMQTAIELYPLAAAYQILTQIELNNRNYGKAIEYAQKAVELSPDTAIHHNNLGVSLYNLGRFDEAVVEMKKAVDLDPESKLYQDNLNTMQSNI